MEQAFGERPDELAVQRIRSKVDEGELQLAGERPADVHFGGGAHLDQGLADPEATRALPDEAGIDLFGPDHVGL